MSHSNAPEILNPTELRHFLTLYAENLDLLAPLLDDLNALEGADFDTGTNASHTLQAINANLQNTTEQSETTETTATLLAASVTYARTFGRGHIGVFIASLFAALGKEMNGPNLRPIELRAFLQNLPTTLQNCFPTAHPTLQAMCTNAAEVANQTPDPIDNPATLIGYASMDAQDAMIETLHNGWTNPGAAVLALFLASLHSTYDADQRHLSTAVQMITNLATVSSKRPLPANPPRQGAEYSVSYLIDTTKEDYENLCTHLKNEKIRYSSQGSTDLLGMGSWRFHLDTSTPNQVIPTFGWVRNILVRTNRYGELVGEDELAVQQETSGVLYLSRPTWQRPETVRVLALTTANTLITDLAATGAWVLVNPVSEDIPLIASLLQDAPGNAAAILPSTPDAYQTAKRAENLLIHVKVNYPSVYSDGVNLICAQHTASIFVPQIGDKTQAITQQLIESGISTGQRRTAIISAKNLNEITDNLYHMIGYGLSRLIIFAQPGAGHTQITDAVAEAFQKRDLDQPEISITHSENPHIVLING